MRLLYLLNSPDSERVAHVAARIESMSVDVTICRAYSGELPSRLDQYDAAYLTGSTHGAYDDIDWIHREHEWILKAAEAGVAMLGVCFGSQILASALCGPDQVFRRPTCEVGYAELSTKPAAADDPLMKGIPRELRMFVWHNDEVRADHDDMVILASSAECPNQIWRFKDVRVWGVQGHPEVAGNVSEPWLELTRATLERDGADVDSLIRDGVADPAADRLLPNFVAAVGRR